MDSSVVPEDAACAVCGRVLDWFCNADGSGGHWDHSEQDKPGVDHVPVPTPKASIKTRYRCDFCNRDTEPEQLHLLRCREFQFVPGAVADENWLTCPTCLALISDDQWAELINHVIAASETLQAAILLGDATPQQLRHQLAHMYALFRANRVGSPEPFLPHGKADNAG